MVIKTRNVKLTESSFEIVTTLINKKTNSATLFSSFEKSPQNQNDNGK